MRKEITAKTFESALPNEVERVRVDPETCEKAKHCDADLRRWPPIEDGYRRLLKMRVLPNERTRLRP